jgi:O-antigen/teichoic acid export membrane protein
METAQRIARNTGIIIAGKIAEKIIALAIVVCLARYLEAGGFGIYSFVFAYLGFFGILMDLGIDTILFRNISRDRSRAAKLIGNGIIMKIFFSFLALLLACFVISFLNYPFDTKLLVYIASLGFLLSFVGYYKLIFKVDLRMGYPVMVDIFTSLLKLALFLYLISLKATLLQFIIVGILSGLPGLFILSRLSQRLVRPRFEIDLGLWRNILKDSWPLALTITFVMIYNRIDQLMLFQMKGAEAVGFYAVAVKPIETLGIIPAAFMTSVFPFISRYFKISKESFKRTYELSFKYMVIIILPIALGITLLAKQIILLMYGGKFLPSVPALAILVWSQCFVFAGVVHTNLLISAEKQRIVLLLTGTSAVVNILLNLLWIPKYGFVGASVATLISYGWAFPFAYLLRTTREYMVVLFRKSIMPLLAIILVSLIIYLTKMSLPIAVVTIPIVFFGILLLTKELSKEDIRIIKRGLTLQK